MLAIRRLSSRGACTRSLGNVASITLRRHANANHHHHHHPVAVASRMNNESNSGGPPILSSLFIRSRPVARRIANADRPSSLFLRQADRRTSPFVAIHLRSMTTANSGSGTNPTPTSTTTNANADAAETMTLPTSATSVLSDPGIIFRLTPKSVHPYLYLVRLDKPIGTWLLLWPCLWSMALAHHSVIPSLDLTFLFSAGALIMRGAGCTINDLWDRDFDKKVERTRTRPLASGDITPFKAIVFLGAQLLAGLGVLVCLNNYSIIVGAASLALVVTYPLMKRVTYWPQLFLGLTFNWGALVGYAAVAGHCDWDIVLPLYVAGICWTLVYDTIYAHQDKKDDIHVGVKSTALRFGAKTKHWLTGFALACGLLLAYTGYANYEKQLLSYQTTTTTLLQLMTPPAESTKAEKGWRHPYPYYAAVILATAHMLHQIHTVDYNSMADCMSKFKSNKNIGWILFLGILAGNYFWTSNHANNASTKKNAPPPTTPERVPLE